MGPNISSVKAVHNASGSVPAGYFPELSDFSHAEGIIWALAMAMICFISSYANGIILIGVLRQTKGLTALDVLLGNLALSNWTLAMATFPFVVVSALQRSWIFGKLCCDLYSFVTLTLGLNSIFTLLGIAAALHASVANVSCNLSSDLINKQYRKLTTRFLVATYTVSVGLSACPLMGIGSYGVGKHGFSCTIEWANHSTISSAYITVLMFVGFFVPLAGTVIIYTKIVKALKNIQKIFSQPELASKWDPVQQETILMGISVTSCFLLCWTPYAVTSMWETYGNGSLLPARVEGGAAFLAKSSSALTPLVHLFFNKKYRYWLQRFFCCCCCCCCCFTLQDGGCACWQQPPKLSIVAPTAGDSSSKRRSSHKETSSLFRNHVQLKPKSTDVTSL